MHEGQSFGKFVAEELLPGQTARVYLAHQRNAQETGAYVVKVVSVAAGEEGDVSAAARKWLDGVSLQDRVAQDWHDVVAPVVERPTKASEVLDALNSGNVWYVTRRYAGSLQNLLKAQGGQAVPGTVIWAICRAVTRGALAFKQVDAPYGGRRSHGNLKPGNILFSRLPIVDGETEIVVTDPAPVLEEKDLKDPARIEKEFERSDLVAIGKILFESVAGREMPEDFDWATVWNITEGDENRWRQVFGRAAGSWRTLCRELLDSGTAETPLSLAGADQRLGSMKPRLEKPLLPKVLAVAALLLFTGLVSWFITTLQLRGTIVVEVSDVPNLEAEVTVRSRSQTNQVQTAPLVAGKAEFEVKAGYDYDVTVKPKGSLANLEASSVNQFVKPRSKNVCVVPINFVLLKVSATDTSGKSVAAELSLDGNTNQLKTLPVTLYLTPTARPHQLDITPRQGTKLLSTNLIVLLNEPGQKVDTNVVLNPERPGFASVVFRAGAMLPITFQVGSESFELGRDRFQMPMQFPRGSSVQVTVKPPAPWEEQSTNWTVPLTNRINFPLNFLQLNTTVQLKWTNTLDFSRLYVAKGPGQTPLLVGPLWERQMTYFPAKAATYTFVVSCKGYKSWTNADVTIVPGITNVVTISDLEAQPEKRMIFEVSPPDAILSETASRTGFAPGTNNLPYGTYSIVALHPMLGSVTNTFVVDASSPMTERWDLPSGTVNITTGQPDLDVMIYPDDPGLAKFYEEQNGNLWLRIGQPIPWTTPVTNAPLPPGGYRIVFSNGRKSATNHIQVALNQVTNISLPQIDFSK